MVNNMKSIYDGINEEIYSLQLSKEEKAFFSDYYSNAGLLNKNSQQRCKHRANCNKNSCLFSCVVKARY